jgi:hypothetical protein
MNATFSGVRAERAAVHLQLCAAIGEILTECGTLPESTLRRAVESAVNLPGFDRALLALVRSGLVIREFGMISESGVR